MSERIHEEFMYFVILDPSDLSILDPTDLQTSLPNLEIVQLPPLPKIIPAVSKCLMIIYLLDTIYSEERWKDLSITLGSMRVFDALSNATYSLMPAPFLSKFFIGKTIPQKASKQHHTQAHERGRCVSLRST